MYILCVGLCRSTVSARWWWWWYLSRTCPIYWLYWYWFTAKWPLFSLCLLVCLSVCLFVCAVFLSPLLIRFRSN